MISSKLGKYFNDIVKINNEIMLQILTNNKEKTLKWAAEDVKKYL